VITSTHPTSLSLGWSDHPDGGSPITQYKVYHREEFGRWKVQRAEPEIRSLEIGDLR
jgi:hypothetical protein